MGQPKLICSLGGGQWSEKSQWEKGKGKWKNRFRNNKGHTTCTHTK